MRREMRRRISVKREVRNGYLKLESTGHSRGQKRRPTLCDQQQDEPPRL